MVGQKREGLQRPPGRMRANARVAREIGLSIVSGEIPVGAILPGKDALMRRFSVSNTSLREALQTLTAKGLIEARTKVGTRVLDPRHWNMFDADILRWRLECGVDLNFLASLFEMRQTLEPMAAALAAIRRSEEEAQDLEELAAGMAGSHHTKETFTAVDVSFHLRLLEASHNPLMRSIGAAISTALAASFAQSAPTDDPERLSLAHRQHSAIADAIRRSDPPAAADAMMVVIRQGWRQTGIVTTPLAEIAVHDYSPKAADLLARAEGEIAK
jgi:DNA-binding FadR family transcriptional regulator